MWKLSPEGLNNLVQGQNVFWLQMLCSFHSPICKSSTFALVPVGQACRRANQQPGPSLLPQIKAQAVGSPTSLTAPLLLFDRTHLFRAAAGLTTDGPRLAANGRPPTPPSYRPLSPSCSFWLSPGTSPLSTPRPHSTAHTAPPTQHSKNDRSKRIHSLRFGPKMDMF